MSTARWNLKEAVGKVYHISKNHNDYLMEKVVERSNLKKALERVERNKGAAGVDNMQVNELLPYLKANWQNIKRELLEGTYKPAPVRRPRKSRYTHVKAGK